MSLHPPAPPTPEPGPETDPETDSETDSERDSGSSDDPKPPRPARTGVPASDRAHPPEDDLVADPIDPDVARHVDSCPRCRIQQRDLRLYREAPSTSEPAGLPDRVVREIQRNAEVAHSTASTSSEGSDRRLIGGGPRGLVYSEFDGRLQRRVVLKMLGDTDRARVIRAKELLDRLRHPALASYHEVAPGEVLSVRRKLFDGEDFAEAIARVRPARIVQWVSRISSALGVLHAAGGAHGGLCPENLRVEPGGRVVVVDAGLGGLPEGSAWRAPELGPDEASPAGDWYALGRILERYAPQLAGGPRSEPHTLAALIGRMCDPDPARRPVAAEVAAVLLLERAPEGLQATRYDEIGIIDRGGMGEVWRVRDPLTRRDVALKRMKPEAAARIEAARRFSNEALIAAQLQHPGIVPVHEVGLADEQPYFTMKLIDGHHLGQIIRWVHDGTRAEWTFPRVLNAYLRMCEAVAFAHSRNVVHLDLKPQNVMVGPYGEVHLLDWGIARLIGRSGRATISVDPAARPGASGTPGYMAPEQRDPRRSDEIGFPTDAFSLGRVLFEILTGRAPTEGPLPPILTLNPAAPRELAAVVERACREAPAERYRGADELGRDVEAWLAGQPVSAYPYTAWERLERRTRPWQGYLALGAVSALIVLFVAALGAFAAWTNQQEAELERARGLVDVARRQLASGDRIEAERAVIEGLKVAEDYGQRLPEARGLLARIRREPYPRRVGACVSRDGVVTCPGGVEWRRALGLPPAVEGEAPRLAPVVGFDAQGLWIEANGARIDSGPLGSLPVATWSCGRRVVARDARSHLVVWTPAAEPGATSGSGASSSGASRPPEVLDVGSVDAEVLVACDPRGLRMAVAYDQQVHVWQIRGQVMEEGLLARDDGPVRSLAWSADGTLLATAGDDSVRLWRQAEWEAERKPREWARIRTAATALAFTQDAPRLVVDGAAPALWDLSPTGAAGRVETSVALRGAGWAGAKVATVDRHNNLRLWDPADGQPTGGSPKEAEVVQAAPAADGSDVAVLTTSGSLAVYALADPVRPRWTADSGGARLVGRGHRWVVTGGDAGVQVWDPRSGAPKARWDTGPVRGLQVCALSPPGSGVAGAAGEREERALVVLDGRAELRRLPGGDLVPDEGWGEGPDFAILSADCRSVAVGRDLTIRIWPEDRTIEVGIPKFTGAFSPAGDLLALAAHDRTVRILDRATGAELARMDVDLGPDLELAFAPDGATLAVAGRRDRVELWDLWPLRASVDEVEADRAARYGPVSEVP